MEPVRLGVIGCGAIGNVHMACAVASPLMDLVAIADLRPEAVAEAAARHGVETTYPSGDALLEDDRVEAVVLAMPTCHRTALALRAFERGKHVLTEKPVAMNAAEVERLIAAQGDRVGACCSSRYSFLASATAAREFARTGALGEVRVVHCRAVLAAGARPSAPRPPWRLSRALNGGGIFVNWGCYDLDYLLGILDWSLKPRVALAASWPVAAQLAYHAAEGSDAETHVAALILCEGGAAISYERAEASTSASEEAWRIVGSSGTLRLHMKPGEGKKILYDTAGIEGLVSRTLWEGDESSDLIRFGVLEDFAVAIREGRRPRTDLKRSLVLQKITDAVYRSAETGRAVEIA